MAMRAEGALLSEPPDPRTWRNLPFYARNLLASLPVLARMGLPTLPEGHISREPIASVAILNGWSMTFSAGRAKPARAPTDAPRLILLDQGPLYMLAELHGRGPLGLLRQTQWWDAMYTRWAGVLDGVVRLDADDAVLIPRCRGTEDGPSYQVDVRPRRKAIPQPVARSPELHAGPLGVLLSRATRSPMTPPAILPMPSPTSSSGNSMPRAPLDARHGHRTGCQAAASPPPDIDVHRREPDRQGISERSVVPPRLRRTRRSRLLLTPLLVSGLGGFYYGMWQIAMRSVGSSHRSAGARWTLNGSSPTTKPPPTAIRSANTWGAP